MHAIVTNMPGFISVKMFTAEDGEVLALAEFESLDALTAWKEHPEHVVAQQRGREEFFAVYRVQICSSIREATFKAQIE
jgi:heme-degrading monooxygenase HmoA